MDFNCSIKFNGKIRNDVKQFKYICKKLVWNTYSTITSNWNAAIQKSIVFSLYMLETEMMKHSFSKYLQGIAIVESCGSGE